MKKKLLALFTLAVIMLGACSPVENEEHVLSVYPLPGSQMTFYADQTIDTLYSIIATDNWSVVAKPSWLQLSPDSVIIKPGRTTQTRLIFAFTPNTSQTIRQDELHIRSVYQGFGGIGFKILQLPTLQFQYPEPSYNTEGGYTLSFPSFKAMEQKSKILITTHDKSTELSANEDWITLSSTLLAAGEHEIQVSISKNTSATERTGSITFTTSNGVTNIIHVTQASETIDQ